jgi:hypothetical protein
MGRQVAKAMVSRSRGTILFTSATASVRGVPAFRLLRRQACVARAGASMARELGPQGIRRPRGIGSAIDTGSSQPSPKDQDGILSPDAIAEVYWQLPCSPAAPGPTDGPAPMAGTW